MVFTQALNRLGEFFRDGCQDKKRDGNVFAPGELGKVCGVWKSVLGVHLKHLGCGNRIGPVRTDDGRAARQPAQAVVEKRINFFRRPGPGVFRKAEKDDPAFLARRFVELNDAVLLPDGGFGQALPVDESTRRRSVVPEQQYFLRCRCERNPFAGVHAKGDGSFPPDE